MEYFYMDKLDELYKLKDKVIQENNKKLAAVYDQIALEYYYNNENWDRYALALKYGTLAHKLDPDNLRIHQNGEYYKAACFSRYKDPKYNLEEYLKSMEESSGLLSGANILDIGPEKGQWGNFIRSICKPKRLDAVEIFTPYIEQNHLNNIYDNVYNENIVKWNPENDIHYDFCIMGDVLEHLGEGQAHLVLEKLRKISTSTYIIVPYYYYQDEFEGNPYQAHVQDDLDNDVMKERYPQLELLFGNEFKGCYRIKYN